MKITVKFFASVREVVGVRVETIEAPAESTVSSVWESYVARFPKLARLGLAYAVNHEYSGPQRTLQEGDEVAFIPPVSGG